MSFIGRKGNIPFQQSLVDDSVRPTGGGVDLPAPVAGDGTDYIQFMRTCLGTNNRIVGAYYHGTTHGQDDPEAICLYQNGISGVPLVLDGNAVQGGEVNISVGTRFSLTSSYNLSYMTATFYGDITIAGVPAASYTMTCPNVGRVFSPGTVKATKITGVTVNSDTIGPIAAGLYALPSNTETRYSDDGGESWSDPQYPINGLLSTGGNGSLRGYQTGLLSGRDGKIVLLVYMTDLSTGISKTVRFLSYNNGESWGPMQDVTFTGTVSGDTRFTIYSPWRQLGDGSFVTVGSNNENTYWATTDDDAETIECHHWATTVYAAPNTLSWQITAIDAGTLTITLASSLGDVTAYFPAVMRVTIASSGGADGTTYVTSSTWDGSNTKLVLNALSAGTIGASSRVRQTYGPAQILSADLGTNSVTVMYDQTANFLGGAYYMGITGSSGGGNQNVDGPHRIASSSYNAGTNRTTIVFSDTIAGTTLSTTGLTRTTNVAFGEWGFDCLTNLTWAATCRPNGQVSKIPIWTTNDGGTNWTFMGQTNVAEGAYVSMTLDFMQNGGVTETVIGGFERGSNHRFFLTCSPSTDLLTTIQTFTPLDFWYVAPSTFPNSGYPANSVFGNKLVITYGVEVSINGAYLACQRVVPPFPSFATTSTNTFTGVQYIPDGALAAPSLAFATATTTGLWTRGSGTIDWSISGVHRMELINGALKMGSGGIFGWNSTSVPGGTGSTDTNVSRIAAGVIGAGTGAAASVAGQFYAATVRTGQTTVAALPAAATAGAGARAFVTDANATTFLSTVAGGGSNNVPVVSDGANWLIG